MPDLQVEEKEFSRSAIADDMGVNQGMISRELTGNKGKAEFGGEGDQPSALSLNDFPFPGGAIETPKSGGMRRGGKENHAFLG
ncbi:MAG: hypothetical protein ACRECP_06530 [Methylocella sp.]